MNIAILSGSHRPDSQSARVARYLQQQLSPLASAWIYELANNPLPLWDQGVWSGSEPWPTLWGPVAEKLRASDALIVVAPEWAGMVPPGVKNFLLLCGNDELGHKPGLIVGISSGISGTWPVAELRMSGTKNNHLCWVPDHLILRGVGKLLQGTTPDGEVDAQVRARIDYSLGLLVEYAKALAAVRASGRVDHKTYAFGQ